MLLSTPFLSSWYLKLPVKLCVLEASPLICHPPPPLANEIVREILKVPVFVGGVFFILTRDLDLQKMWVACIKEQKIISCLYSWHLLNNFSFVNIFCKSRLTFFHCIWCVLRVSTYVLCVQHVFTIGMILSATERHTVMRSCYEPGKILSSTRWEWTSPERRRKRGIYCKPILAFSVF